MAEEALRKAREIAARLSGGVSTGTDLGKRKNRWDDETGDAPAKPSGFSMGGTQDFMSAAMNITAGLGSVIRKKVYIPAKEHPEQNYLGLLIGPGGQTQKAFQQKTGTKIIFRGFGASKDGGYSNTGNPVDDMDDLHVSIEGPAPNVELAIREIQKVLDNPEEARRAQAEQVRSLAAMSTSQAVTVYGEIQGTGELRQLDIAIPNPMVGLVIGKGGENILRLQIQLAVTITIQQEKDMAPGATTRLLSLKGSLNGVIEARRRIEEVVGNQLYKNSQLAGAMATNPYVQSKDLDNPFVVRLPVPNDKVGLIIGKGGMTVKQIQEKCRVTVFIPVGPDEDNPQIRTLSIGGDTKEQVDTAQVEIFMTLNQQQQQLAIAAGQALSFTVPDEKVGLIIGKSGMTVKELQNRLNVKVIIPQQADAGSFPPVRTLSIIGAPDVQIHAKYEIEMICQGTPVNPTNPHTGQSLYGQAAMPSMYGMGMGGMGGMGMGMDMYGYPQAGMAQQQYMQQSMGGMMQQPYGQMAGGYYNTSAISQYGGQPQATSPYEAATSTEVAPSDPTAYYNDYWQYASYYGEAAARVYYGAWSPPVGTPAPAGMVIPADPTGNTQTQTQATNDSNSNGISDTSNKEAVDNSQKNNEDSGEYKEWYDAYGKDAGASPNPPMNP